MKIRHWSAAALIALLPGSLSARKAVPPPPLILTSPPPPMMVTSAHEGNYATLLSEVSSQWEDGHPDKAIAMLEEAVGQYSFKGLNGHKEHVVLADLITALSYSDLPKAQARYDAWVKAFPVSPIKNPLDTLRLPVNTRLLVLQGKSAEARAFVTAEAATRDAMQAEHQARIAAEIQAKTRKKGEYRDQDFVFDRTMSGYSRAIRLSEFILESHERGEAAFADFTAQGRNPFFETTSSMTLHSSIKLSCASSGLTINDWLIVDIGFDRDGRNAIALPFAASSPAAIQPLLEALGDANISIGGMRDVTERTKLLLRCTRATPQAPDILADYSYMRGYFLPMVANTKAAANYNIFTDPPSNLVRDKEWLVLLNYAYAPHTLRPEKFVPTQAALLGALQAMPTPDPVAIAIVQHWMLPDAPTGQNQRLRNILPLYIDSVAKLKDVPGMPPRVRAYLEFKLGEMHETLGEPVAAEALYRAIVARSPAELPDKSSEVTRARLRLAAIAEASGRYSESAALFDALGLSPEQCSLYQARPAITSFKSPDYPVAALRNEVQGNVDFEFDLDATGKPTNFRVLASTPPFVFDKDTIRSFSKASFAPATRGGKALPCEAATQTFTWRVAD